ncbi:Receptor-like protein 2 [Morus notabilis]|uniref:Receptor-like protein 2 n=1 Tax=Morus notabilis TaxID=981085 RepID=W9RN05_9ROSA|nr:Receptor-like protein 2 [Morus notabilis]
MVLGTSSIYLGSNKLEGPLSRISSDLVELDLSNNSFSEEISRLLCHPMEEKNELSILNLGNNLLSGEIRDCWMRWQSLEVMVLKSNNLTREIPSSMGSLQELEVITLLDVADSSPLTSLMGLMSLNLSGNHLGGSIPDKIGDMTWIQSLDLLRNNPSENSSSSGTNSVDLRSPKDEKQITGQHV